MPRRTGRTPLAGLLLAALLALAGAACTEPGAPAARDCPDGAPECRARTSPAPSDTAPSDTAPSGAAPSPPTATASATAGIPPAAPPATPAPGGSRTSAAPGGACASPAACGFPDARTTGHRTALEPHDTGYLAIRENGTVIRGWDITGSLDIYADDVTVIDSRITSDNWWGINLRPGHKGLRVLHSTITAVPGEGPDNGGVDYAVSNMGGGSIEVGWCDVSVFGDALSMGQGHLHDNYVHDLVPFVNLGGEWQHTNAVISGGGNTGHLVIRHNTLLNPTGLKQGASGSIGLFADTGVVRNVTVDRNWIAGGAYALYGGAEGATHIEVTDNVFSTQYHPASGGYGVVAHWNADGAGNVWRNNRMSDGRPVHPEPAA
ncbi:hypothetical protein [Streptomyces griseoviridis]|uniref:Lipoprotein n=1 Tax=Streptomyces griseoviridis TaxID=45398 RepID=A0ABT9L7J7_STRGD|nr:hypothetical protein [Streptomyces griseoviridis]MDP9679658.1 hypothetical protein [Streptomyces griseoviridis]GGS99626.1 hypothetical protein GCM10010240_36180 [Streptomyces griseoviridis]